MASRNFPVVHNKSTIPTLVHSMLEVINVVSIRCYSLSLDVSKFVTNVHVMDDPVLYFILVE